MIKNKAEAAYRRLDQLEKCAKLMSQRQKFVDTRQGTATVTTLKRTA